MASTYVNDLRLEEITTGEQAGTWGDTTNRNLELIAEAFGYGTEALSDASTQTITLADGVSDAARSFYLKLTGSLSQNTTVTLAPNTVSKVWIIENATTDAGSSGPYSTIIKQGTGATITIPNGTTKMVATDGGGSGAAVYDLFASLSINPIISTALLPDAAGGADLGTASLEFGDVYIADDKYINFGSDQNVVVGYDENGNDSLEIKANVEGAALALTLSADQADDNADTWKLNVADGGIVTLASYISGSFVAHLTVTPNATAASSTIAAAGNVTVGGDATITGDVMGGSLGVENTAGDWTFEVSSNKLLFKYGGTSKMELDTSGNLKVTGDVTAYGSI